jgi:hypothetical protein
MRYLIGGFSIGLLIAILSPLAALILGGILVVTGSVALTYGIRWIDGE